jgi:hypothetical protein
VKKTAFPGKYLAIAPLAALMIYVVVLVVATVREFAAL